MSNLALGIDIGGTNLVAAVIDQQGTMLSKFTTPSRAAEGGEALMRRVIALARQTMQAYPVRAVGVGSAGQINPETGACTFANENLPGWTGMPIRARLEEALGLPVIVDNDANAAALGECRFGAGRGARDLICLTIGTGIGGGIIVDGKLLHGARGSAGEVGHIIVETGGAHCPCGMQGCLEAYASATAIVRRTREALASSHPATALHQVEPLTSHAIFTAAANGDPLAEAIVERTAKYLAVGLAGMINLTDPDLVLLGGGVSLAGQPFLERIDRYLQSWAMTRGRARLGLCALGDNAGVIGAGALAYSLSEA